MKDNLEKSLSMIYNELYEDLKLQLRRAVVDSKLPMFMVTSLLESILLDFKNETISERNNDYGIYIKNLEENIKSLREENQKLTQELDNKNNKVFDESDSEAKSEPTHN